MKKIVSIIMMCFSMVCLLTSCEDEPEAKNVLKSPQVITEELLVGEKIELALYEETIGYIEENYNDEDIPF